MLVKRAHQHALPWLALCGEKKMMQPVEHDRAATEPRLEGKRGLIYQWIGEPLEWMLGLHGPWPEGGSAAGFHAGPKFLMRIGEGWINAQGSMPVAVQRFDVQPAAIVAEGRDAPTLSSFPGMRHQSAPGRFSSDRISGPPPPDRRRNSRLCIQPSGEPGRCAQSWNRAARPKKTRARAGR